MTLTRILGALVLALLPVALSGQGRGLPPAELLKPLGESWPTYSGDYSGRRYSPLMQVNRDTVKRLGLAWTVSGEEDFTEEVFS